MKLCIVAALTVAVPTLVNAQTVLPYGDTCSGLDKAMDAIAVPVCQCANDANRQENKLIASIYMDVIRAGLIQFEIDFRPGQKSLLDGHPVRMSMAESYTMQFCHENVDWDLEMAEAAGYAQEKQEIWKAECK